jgi:hypothetical protein
VAYTTLLNTTVATVSSTNASPELYFQANYWNGSASAQDTWGIQQGLAAGTNGISNLTFYHSGSTAANVQFNTSVTIGTPSATNLVMETLPGNSAYAGLWSSALALSTSNYALLVDNTGNTFINAATAQTIALSINNTGVCSIASTGLTVTGTINATTSYQANGTPGVTQTAIAVGTLATKFGIVTTFTGVSDERLKNHAPYTGGLEEILGITPIRFTYNELGQKFGGWDKDHVYVGFSAQNVQKNIPEAIQGTEGEEEYLSFDDRPVIAALVNAVKELTKRIKSLESKQQGEQLC